MNAGVSPSAAATSSRAAPTPSSWFPELTGPRWPPRRRSKGTKVLSAWMALGSRNGVGPEYRRPGESPPRNRLETPRPTWPGGAPLQHAEDLHAVSSQILSALGCLRPGRALSGRAAHAAVVHHRNAADGPTRHHCLASALYSASSGERSGPWSNLMPLTTVCPRQTRRRVLSWPARDRGRGTLFSRGTMSPLHCRHRTLSERVCRASLTNHSRAPLQRDFP